MSTNELDTKDDADMTEYEGEKVVTMMDVLQEQQEFEEDANAVLGASDDKDCTYSKGYVKRQALYACLTCCSEAKNDPNKRAGVCLACSLNCHENHELVELYTKRNFRCDCGNPKFNSHPCQFTPKKNDFNEENRYNQNFSGIYCICHRPYPDPEYTDEVEMIQCIICEDWLHTTHIEATVPANDQYSEMICKLCMEKNDFLHDYSDLAVNVENMEVDIETTVCSEENLLIATMTVVNGAESSAISNDKEVKNDTNSDKPEYSVISNIVSQINDDKTSTLEHEPDDNKIQTEQEKTENESDLIKQQLQDFESSNDPMTENMEQINEETNSSSNKLTMNSENVSEKENNDNADNIETSISELSTEHMVVENQSSITDIEEEKETKEPTDCITENITTNSTCEENTIEDSANKENTDEFESNVSNCEENTVEDNTDKVNADKLETNSSTCEENTAEDHTNKENVDKFHTNGSTCEENTIEGDTDKENADKFETNDTFESEVKKRNINETVTENDNINTKETAEQENNENEITPDTSCANDNKTSFEEQPVLDNIEIENGIPISEHETNNASNAVGLGCERVVIENREKTDYIDNEAPTDTEMPVDTTIENDLSDKENEAPLESETITNDNKRKLSTEDSNQDDDITIKKPKLGDKNKCLRPKRTKRYKGATFWTSNLRQKLCTCSECISMYKDLSVLFLIDPEDTVTAYENLGKEKINGTPATQYEKGLEALSSLDRVQQINALTEYNKMRDKLLEFLKSFKDRKEIVKEEDIKAFFAGMKPKREPDGVYFCR